MLRSSFYSPRFRPKSRPLLCLTRVPRKIFPREIFSKNSAPRNRFGRKPFMNCVKMRRRQRKTKDAFSIFAPYTLFPTQEFESIPEKTPLRPERRLMLAVLEETVAYVLELCRETEGSNQYGCIILYFCHSRIYCGPASQPCLKHELDHLILFLIAGIDFK